MLKVCAFLVLAAFFYILYTLWFSATNPIIFVWVAMIGGIIAIVCLLPFLPTPKKPSGLNWH